MKIVKQSLYALSLGIFLSLLPVKPCAGIHSAYQVELAFAMNAPRPELVNAYLRKCEEAYNLNQALANANKTNWKNIAKGVGVGAIMGLSVSAILYIITR